MDYNAASRQTIIREVEIFQPGEFPNTTYPKNTPVWLAMVRTKTGLLPDNIGFLTFETEAQAREFERKNPPGTVLPEKTSAEVDTELREWLESIMDGPSAGVFLNVGGDDGYLAWQILSESGVNDGINTSKHVIDYLGSKRVEALKNIHGGNWNVAAEFEYCWLNYDKSSPTFIAAAYEYHTYITGNDFSAGYLLRDLECLVHGIEAGAMKAKSILAAAKAGGAARSANSKAQRDAVLDEMARLIGEGKSVSSAALIAANRGIGRSQDANRKAWSRHKSGT